MMMILSGFNRSGKEMAVALVGLGMHKAPVVIATLAVMVGYDFFYRNYEKQNSLELH